ncbi:outer membrane protein [Devosia sp. 2618]|uniref:outer membrane protein n=1 Tax=Devosia sp. 2618 TaxID=3156454 RepID=UPI0033928F40
MLKVLSASATFAVLSVSGVMAQNLSLSQADPIAMGTSDFSWTGFYAGVNGGYGWGNLTTTNLDEHETFDVNGGIGGVQVGYNQDFGGFVLGIEADFGISNVTKSVDFYDQGIFFGTATNGVRNLATVRGRAGVAIDRLLPYITGGLAVGSGQLQYNLLGETFGSTQTHVGWSLGAGLEYAVSDRLTVRAEYLYTDLGTAHYDAASKPPFFLGTPFDNKINFGTVRGGINFKF